MGLCSPGGRDLFLVRSLPTTLHALTFLKLLQRSEFAAPLDTFGILSAKGSNIALFHIIS